MSLDIVGIPAIKHSEQDLINPLRIGLGNAWICTERVELPPVLLLRHHRQAEAQREYWNDSTEISAVRHPGSALISNCTYFASHFYKSTPVVLAREEVRSCTSSRCKYPCHSATPELLQLLTSSRVFRINESKQLCSSPHKAAEFSGYVSESSSFRLRQNRF